MFGGAKVETKTSDMGCPGNAITVWSGIRGACAIGKLGVSAEKVAAEACGGLQKELKAGAAVDLHLADQLMIYLALAGEGKLQTSLVSGHAKTNAMVISKFLPVGFKFEGNGILVTGKPPTIKLAGIP